jgi:hypothetical protein
MNAVSLKLHDVPVLKLWNELNLIFEVRQTLWARFHEASLDSNLKTMELSLVN